MKHNYAKILSKEALYSIKSLSGLKLIMSLNDGALFAETGCEAISTPCFIFGFCTPDKFVPLVSELVVPELLLSLNELGVDLQV